MICIVTVILHTAHVNEVHLRFAKCVSHISAQKIYLYEQSLLGLVEAVSLKNILRTALSHITMKIGAKNKKIH